MLKKKTKSTLQIDWNYEKVGKISGKKYKKPSLKTESKNASDSEVDNVDFEIDNVDFEIEAYDANTHKTFDNAENVMLHLKDAGLHGIYGVVISDSKTIQVDIDTPESLEVFENNYKILKPLLGGHDVIKTLSKSKKLHITIKTNKWMSGYERIALQSVLGSDLIREALNYRNVKKKYKNPILFVEENSQINKTKENTPNA